MMIMIIITMMMISVKVDPVDQGSPIGTSLEMIKASLEVILDYVFREGYKSTRVILSPVEGIRFRLFYFFTLSLLPAL